MPEPEILRRGKLFEKMFGERLSRLGVSYSSQPRLELEGVRIILDFHIPSLGFIEVTSADPSKCLGHPFFRSKIPRLNKFAERYRIIHVSPYPDRWRRVLSERIECYSVEEFFELVKALAETT